MHMATKPQTDSVTRKERVQWGEWGEMQRGMDEVPLIWTRGSWMLMPMSEKGRKGGGEVLGRGQRYRERLNGRFPKLISRSNLSRPNRVPQYCTHSPFLRLGPPIHFCRLSNNTVLTKLHVLRATAARIYIKSPCERDNRECREDQLGQTATGNTTHTALISRIGKPHAIEINPRSEIGAFHSPQKNRTILMMIWRLDEYLLYDIYLLGIQYHQVFCIHPSGVHSHSL